jgi:WD40 repeat protein
MVWVWNVEAGQEREIRSATKTWGRSWYVPQFTADQQQLAIPFDWNHVSLWDFGGSGEALQFEGIHPGIQNVALSSDGKMVATVNINGTVKVWDVASRREIISMEGRGLPMCAVTFSPDGRRVITGSVDEIKVWDVRTGREVANIREDPVGALYLRFEGPDTLMAASLYGLRRLHAPSFAEIEAAEAKGKIGDGRWKMGNGTSGR